MFKFWLKQIVSMFCLFMWKEVSWPKQKKVFLLKVLNKKGNYLSFFIVQTKLTPVKCRDWFFHPKLQYPCYHNDGKIEYTWTPLMKDYLTCCGLFLKMSHCNWLALMFIQSEAFIYTSFDTATYGGKVLRKKKSCHIFIRIRNDLFNINIKCI